MSTLTALSSSQKYAVDRLCRETGCTRDEASSAYISSKNLFDPAKALLLKGKQVVVVPAPVEVLPEPQKPTAPVTSQKPSVAPPAGLDTFPVRMSNGGALRVVRLPEDYIARSRAEWQKKVQDEETDELLAIGYTITRALDLCSRLAERTEKREVFYCD